MRWNSLHSLRILLAGFVTPASSSMTSRSLSVMSAVNLQAKLVKCCCRQGHVLVSVGCTRSAAAKCIW